MSTPVPIVEAFLVKEGDDDDVPQVHPSSPNDDDNNNSLEQPFVPAERTAGATRTAAAARRNMPPVTTTSTTRTVFVSRDRRGCCSWLGNIVWLLLGGWHLCLTWLTVGVALCATCIGIPCGLQCFKIALFWLFPFGKRVVSTENDAASCCNSKFWNCFFNVIWACTLGWILALQALLTGIILCLTIFGIPLAIPCFQSMVLCFCPFGIDITAEETFVTTTTTTTTRQMVANEQGLTANYQAMESV